MASLPKLQKRPRSLPKARKLSGALEGTPTRSCPHVYIHQSKHAAGMSRRQGAAFDISGSDSVPTGGDKAERMDPLRHLQHFSAAVDSRVAAFFEASENFPCKRIGNYLLGKKLGEGAFAKVRLGIHRPTGQTVGSSDTVHFTLQVSELVDLCYNYKSTVLFNLCLQLM